MFRKLFGKLRKRPTKAKKLNRDLQLEATTESCSKVQEQEPSEFSDLYLEITQSWIAAGISCSLIPAGKKLFSGQSNQDHEAFDYSHNARQYGFGMWLTEGLSYAKDYCYGDKSKQPSKGRILFEVEANRDIQVIEFPPNYHPAIEIRRMVDGFTPDVFVSKHWDTLLEVLVEADRGYSGVKGHIRKQVGCSLSQLGVAHNGLVEVWINDLGVLNQISATKVPKSRDEFLEQYGNCAKALPGRIFN